MKKAGYVCIVFGSISLLGCILGGTSVFGPLFWIAVGIALIHKAKSKVKSAEELKEWENNNKI